MTHRLISHDGDGEPCEELQCTEEELEQAGFQVGDLEEVLDDGPEFSPSPGPEHEPALGRSRALGELVELLDIDPRP